MWVIFTEPHTSEFLKKTSSALSLDKSIVGFRDTRVNILSFTGSSIEIDHVDYEWARQHECAM